MEEKFNLNEIQEISEDEFREELQNWMETNSVAKTLQAKLRKDLIDNFNRTTLGRQIALQHEQSQRMILSPMILGLNTLVAEFLYAQNCHFTLSVFASEVPHKNALPNFENSEQFRFNEQELKEILEAFGVSEQYKELAEQIMEHYLSKGSPINTSLLHSVLKRLIEHNTKVKAPIETVDKNPPETIKSGCGYTKSAPSMNVKMSGLSSRSRTKHKSDNPDRYFRHFSGFLEYLTQHMAEMNEKFTITADENIGSDIQSQTSTEKLTALSVNLDRVTENLLHLSHTPRHNRRVATIVSSITKLTNEIAKCTETIGKFTATMQQTQNSIPKTKNCSSQTLRMKTNDSPTTYNAWLDRMKSSNFYQIHIERIEQYLRKATEREREKMTKSFEEKLEVNRMMLRLHYKQKMLEKCRSSFGRINMNTANQDQFNELIESKLRLIQQQKDSCVATPVRTQSDHGFRPADNVELRTSLEATGTVQDNCENIAPKTNKKSSMAIKLSELSCHKSPMVSIEPEPIIVSKKKTLKLNEESHTDEIVEFAKNRLKELEKESNQLDQAFENYLDRQECEKQKLTNTVSQIWEKYNLGKQILNEVVIPRAESTTRISIADDIPQCKQLPSQNKPLDLTTPITSVDAVDIATENRNPIEMNFENHFRNINVNEIRLRRSMEIKSQTEYNLKSFKSQRVRITDNPLDKPWTVSRSITDLSTNSIQMKGIRSETNVQANVKSAKLSVSAPEQIIPITQKPLQSHVLKVETESNGLTKNNRQISNTELTQKSKSNIMAIELTENSTEILCNPLHIERNTLNQIQTEVIDGNLESPIGPKSPCSTIPLEPNVVILKPYLSENLVFKNGAADDPEKSQEPVEDISGNEAGSNRSKNTDNSSSGDFWQ